MTDRRRTAMIVLGLVQNSTENRHRDVITFTGFMDDEECITHTLAEYRALSVPRKEQILQTTRVAVGMRL